MVKKCLFCGRYFKPDPRVGQNQKACFRDCCKRARKQLAQNDWLRRNPDYFRGRYWYVKQWRQRRKELARRQMIQDEILFQRLDKKTFMATGRPNDTRRDRFEAG